MDTKLLYLDDSYQKTALAKVTSITTGFILDKTIFYVEGGGQPSDQGTIISSTGTFKVDQVRLIDNQVIHEGRLSGIISPDQEVELQIDWTRRYKNMQIHSAGHLLHEAVKQVIPDITAVSAHHGKKPFLKYHGSITPDRLEEIKNKVNVLIQRHLDIYTEFVALEELQKRSSWIPKNLPSNKPLRIVWIEGFDPIPDGGTQVKNTGEIPPFDQLTTQSDNSDTLLYYHLGTSDSKTIASSSLLSISSPTRDKLNNLKNEALAMIMQAENPQELENLRIQYLGKSGQLTAVAKEFKTLSPDQKADLGVLFNDVKTAITTALETNKLSTTNPQLPTTFDPTLPGQQFALGHLHPVTAAINEISDIFSRISFTRVRYPEVEWDWFAFSGLNFPDGHPARDDWETFFVDAPDHLQYGKMLLTPHTSSGQIREMEKTQPPIRMINIAKCYRRQSDISHTVMFHQFEGLVVDHNITITNLRGTIEYFVKSFFGPDRTSRLRPYHFQFTEPSFEVDISCGICGGKGCRLCKQGWLELGGAGMVHPNVLTNCKIDPSEYSGFAFGWGVERCYMMKSGTKIDDIRLLYDNDLRFLNQF